jgi:predicted enzyme related to lactoylglutathione lyase
MADVTLNLVVLRSADIARAAAFYSKLGIEFVREKHGSGPEHLACSLGKVVLEIYPNTDANVDSPARIGFLVQSVAETVAAVQNGGGVIVSQPKESAWGLRAVIADPDGNRVELMERKT